MKDHWLIKSKSDWLKCNSSDFGSSLLQTIRRNWKLRIYYEILELRHTHFPMDSTPDTLNNAADRQTATDADDPNPALNGRLEVISIVIPGQTLSIDAEWWRKTRSFVNRFQETDLTLLKIFLYRKINATAMRSAIDGAALSAFKKSKIFQWSSELRGTGFKTSPSRILHYVTSQCTKMIFEFLECA